jgi:hypothetical protein
MLDLQRSPHERTAMSEADQRRAWRYAEELRKYVRLEVEPTSGLLLGVAALLERLAVPQPAEPK